MGRRPGTIRQAAALGTLAAAAIFAAAAAGQEEGRVVFADEFDGEILSEAWERVDPDDDQFVVEGGEAIVVCRERARRPDKTVFAFNALRLKEALPADFEITIEFEYEAMDGQTVAIELVQDAENRISASTWFSNNRNHLLFTKVVAGQANRLETPSKGFPRGERRVESIRIVKQGRSWLAFQKIAEKEWMVEHKVARFTPAYVELTAFTDDPGQRQDEVRFRRFELRELGGR